jgi:hypothetical protein
MRALAAAGVLLMVLGVQVAFQGAAHARCDGENEITSDLRSTTNVTYAVERPVEGGCNNNGTYRGMIRSLLDNYYVSVWIQNGGVWTGHMAPTRGYQELWWAYDYADANSYSLIFLCVSSTRVVGSGSWYCGWGARGAAKFTTEFHGVNRGY